MNPYSRIISFLMTALAALALAAHAQPAGAESGEVLGPGDTIRVTVFQNPELTTEARIANDGTIRMPLIGPISLKGLSTGDAVTRIVKLLKNGQYLKDPQVNITVLQLRSRQVSVLGQVARPGRYPLDDTSTRLTDVLALAGGITPAGDETVTVITNRNGKTTKKAIDVSKMVRGADLTTNIELQNGDTVYVQRAPVFYIYGQVQRAGAYRLEEHLNVIQAISLGGGVTLRGTESGIKIHRRAADGSIAKIDASPSDIIQADDVIYIKESLF